MKNKRFVVPLIVIVVSALTADVISFIFGSVISGVVVSVCSLIGILAYVISSKKRYKDISDLSDYLYKVCNGIETLDIRDNSEGELSILKNNIYKTTLTLRSQAELLNKDKLWLSNSLADISHQLKTPITSIIVMTDLLNDNNLSAEKRKEFLLNIEKQTEKMEWLIVTLLKISKFDARVLNLKKEDNDLKKVIQKSVKPFMVQMELKGITLRNNMEEAHFMGDEEWSVEAFQNIIKNCIEHMKEGDVLSLYSQENAIYSLLTIQDTGCGIEKEDLPHIFERFYKGKNSSADSVGIGLALSKSILSRENAKIEVKSEKGKGTKFEIYFYKNVM